MNGPVDLYNSHYALTEADTYRQIRLETYGEDLGQTSWITAPEMGNFLAWMVVRPKSAILEVACGSGGISMLLARELGASVTGIDINEEAIQAARERAAREGFSSDTSFQVQDASRPLAYDDGSFEVVFCNDSINHLPDRGAVLQDWHRLLKPSGVVLFTDPILVTGPLSNREIAIRSSIGFFHFVPQGENERLIRESGFEILRVEDLTHSTEVISKRWSEARASREQLLVEMEGQERYDGLQSFLETAHTLSRERRLSRFAYFASKNS
jgi:ubiquinone/menaquinone biosynthesis C-methylase UbiE